MRVQCAQQTGVGGGEADRRPEDARGLRERKSHRVSRAMHRGGARAQSARRETAANRSAKPPGRQQEEETERLDQRVQLTYFCTMGIRRPTPKASGVIFNPGAACLRLYSLRSTLRAMSLTTAGSKPRAARSPRERPSST